MSWETFVGYLITGLLALTGAWVGARLALANFKLQRAIDVRLEWHRDSLSIVSKASASTKLEAEEMDPEQRTQFENTQDTLRRIYVEASGFMSSGSAADLRRNLGCYFGAMLQARRAHEEIDDTSSVEPYLSAVKDAASMLQGVADNLIEGLQELVPLEDQVGPLNWLRQKTSEAFGGKDEPTASIPPTIPPSQT